MTGSGLRLVLATRNPGKLRELRRILAEVGLDVELLSLDEFPAIGDIPETGLTFAENSLIKAHAVATATGLPAVADDSGLCVDALSGMPGVFSARWSGGHGDDKANLNLLLAQIADVPDGRRGGHFACAAALALPSGTEHVVEGALAGSIIREPRGTGGFGYDPIFVPEGGARTLAEIPPAEKDAMSHRGRAFRPLALVVADLLRAV
ncbi:XTP/dITP diphosphohydrolase [Sinosporangium album]|uniref:dITP/XTP pyrophosphatase n=1 Tax=Sinosporangium album TaxID=504805 RepID=A0A1G7V793_9ACTN|nr:RdgB/HAM1 family non-canonical purine NTP pyrophosphatase [Sinosporangium album]SDG55633.1 XTP/dITP diphosphohydrolase [Sinosporangium album]